MPTLLPAPGRAVARLAAACLVLEAFVAVFAALAATGLSGLPAGTVWLGGGGLALAFLVVAGLARRRSGLVLGWVLQAALLATAAWVPAMLFLGAVFALLWGWLLSLGARIDREQAAREEAA